MSRGDLMINETYTVYCHEAPNGKRYVGITKRDVERRWGCGYGYRNNHHFWNAIKKYGWNNFEHYILFEGLNREQAYSKEIELIALWDLTDKSKGYNVSTGGWGNSGYHMPNEVKQKISNSNKGKKHSEETKRKLSQIFKGRPSSRKGVKLTDEQKQHLRDVLKGRSLSDETYQKLLAATAKPVLQFDINGVFIEEFVSIIDVEKKLGYFNSNISACCSGKIDKVKNYIWLYKSDYSSDLLMERLKKIRENNNTQKQVNQLSLDGELIETYPSIRVAAKTVGVAPINIEKCCRGKRKTSKGWRWEFVLMSDLNNLVIDEVMGYGFIVSTNS